MQFGLAVDFSDLEQGNDMVVKTLRNIEPGEELFVTYSVPMYLQLRPACRELASWVWYCEVNTFVVLYY